MSTLPRFHFFEGAVYKQLALNYNGAERAVHRNFEQKHCGMKHVVNETTSSSLLGSVNTIFAVYVSEIKFHRIDPPKMRSFGNCQLQTSSLSKKVNSTR